MIEFKTGNILRAESEALVNTVNCVGVMGRGIAAQFKDAFPENFRAYAAACKREELEPGRMFIYETGQLTNPRFIVNFPTKRHWRGKSRLTDIEAGLTALVADIQRLGITSIAVPPLGSGLGGLEWSEVRPLMVKAFGALKGVSVTIFEPNATFADNTHSSSKTPPRMTPGRAALIVLMQQYLKGLMDPFVSLLEVHKLMYFMQEAGEKLQLKYSKAPYGPFAENLRHVLLAVEGHFVTGYAADGDKPNQRLELVPGAVRDAEALLEEDLGTRNRFERVAQLVEGFETPFGLELLSTVHWVATKEGATEISAAVQRTHAWSDRKAQFSRHQIAIALDTLSEKGWLRTA